LMRLGVKAITHPDDIAQGRGLFGELRAGTRDFYRREKRYWSKNGKLVWAESSASAVRDHLGKLRYVISMVEDITADKQAQEEFRRLPQRIIDAQETERMRVAQELHDGVNQLLASARMRLQKVEANDSGLSPANREILARCTQLLVHALEENRRIAHNLRPADLDQLGLAIACQNLCREVRLRTNLDVTLNVKGLRERLPAQVELHLFRIIQEALNNVEKHARATKVSVQISGGKDSIGLVVHDDGRRRFSQPLKRGENKRGGMGLTNMRERAASLEGTCEVSSVPKKGTTVTVRIPRPDGK
jgi:two-component system, NarL family, sensor kinase